MKFSCSSLFFPGFTTFDMKLLPQNIGIELYEDLIANIPQYIENNSNREISLHKSIMSKPQIDNYNVKYRVSHTPIDGLITCIENVPNESIEQFVNKIGNNYICIDIGHVMMSHWGIENYINFIHQHRDKIKCYHVSVNNGEQDYHNPITVEDYDNKYLKAHFLTAQAYTPNAIQCLEYWFDSYALYFQQSQMSNLFHNKRFETYRYNEIDRINFIKDNIKLIEQLFLEKQI